MGPLGKPKSVSHRTSTGSEFKMKAVIVLLALVGFVQATILPDVLKAEFRSFREKHPRIYKNLGEELKRMQIFKDNMEVIEKHNKRFAAGEETYEMGVNEFTDMSPSEFKRLMLTNGINTDDLMDDVDYIYNPSTKAALPSSVDWRSSGAVNPVKDQGQCGSCWAFSAVGALESHYYLKTRQRVSLSEQNLVDCTRGAPYGNYGCGGGWTYKAFNYIRDYGINTASYYPYEARNNTCRYNRNYIGAKISGYIGIAQGSESALASAVANKGPISVCIDASLFQYYKGGVFNQPSCSKRTNHCIVVDGYGTDRTGGDYWLSRNSWGVYWGENGYIRMARNRNNQCAIASFARYPLI